jgi:hypothetical protein
MKKITTQNQEIVSHGITSGSTGLPIVPALGEPHISDKESNSKCSLFITILVPVQAEKLSKLRFPGVPQMFA